MSRSSVKTEDNLTVHRNSKGQVHRLDGPAKYNDNQTEWFWLKNGVEHRYYSPSAKFPDGSIRWMVNGLLHNTLGPAILHGLSSRYYLNGVGYSKEDWEKLRRSILKKELKAIAKKENLQLNETPDCFYFSKLGESKNCWHRIKGPAFFNLLSGKAAWYQNGSLIRSDNEFFGLTEKEWLAKYQPKKPRKKKVKEPVIEVQAKVPEILKPSTTEEAVEVGELTFKKWDNGGITYYNKNGAEHNPYGPSSVSKDGIEYYFLNGTRHRDNGPSFYDPVLKTEEWLQNGKFHRIGGPAIVAPLGKLAGCSISLSRLSSYDCPTKQWYEEGKKHRLDGPAVICLDGRQEYWINGKQFSKLDWLLETKQLYKWTEKYRIFYTSDAQGKTFHNPEGPAEEWSNGSKTWWLNGKRHRENDLPAVEFSNGSKEWWEDGAYFKSINIGGRKMSFNSIDGPNLTSASFVLEYYTDKKGQRHRTDGPAVINQDGTVEYYVNGKKLSEDEFNVKYNVTELAFEKSEKKEDILVSEKPIGIEEFKLTYKSGTSEEYTIYYKDVEKTIKHRLNDPAIEWVSGRRDYYLDGKRHRLDGPAIDGTDKQYWIEGKRHRLNGPAIERADGSKDYWINNICKTESEFLSITSPNKKLALQVASNQIKNKFSRMMGNRNKISQHLLTYVAGHALTSKVPNLGKELRVDAMTHLGLDFLQSLEKHLDVSKLEEILSQMKPATEAPLDTSPKPTYIQVSRSERVVSLDANGQEIVS